jgi:uncharacterized protein YjbJ (UPF0337 family)
VKITHPKQETMSTETELSGTWDETKGKLKQKFALLTDGNTLIAEGRQDELLGRLQIKLGKSKEEIQKLIAEI